jgi:SAM-dependent methyltransferase
MNSESPPSLREIVAELSGAATTLATLGAALQARRSGQPLHEAIRLHARAVLENAGVWDALQAADDAELDGLIAEVRHFWLLDDAFLRAPQRSPGWGYADPDILQTGGELTRGFAGVLPQLAAGLDGLAARLSAPDGRFLDVGTGVGMLAIAVAQRFPSLRVVGVDVLSPALALARENVDRAGLGDRIELREQRGEDLPDESTFDLAWLPAPFIPAAALPALVTRVHRALKPGGWLLFASARASEDLRGSILRMRVAHFGGAPSTETGARELLSAFADVRVLPGPPKDFKMVVAARKSAK